MGEQNILSDLTWQRHKDGAYVFSRKPVSGLLGLRCLRGNRFPQNAVDILPPTGGH
jgi:hypothetical protein